MAPKTYAQRRDEALEHTDTDGWYNAKAAKAAALPSCRREAENARAARNRRLRRRDCYYRVDRCPPNKSNKEARAELARAINAIRARGDHVDHIVPWMHPQLRGLHTLANIQGLTPRRNKIKGARFTMTEAEIEAHIDAGRAVRLEHVDDDGSRTGKPGTVDWSQYPQHRDPETEL